jgi:phage tail-like protein
MPSTPQLPSPNGKNGSADAVTAPSRRLIRVKPQDRHPPEVASARSYLRRGLPSIYHEDEFGMRFVQGFEKTLDPIMAILDSLPAYFDPATCPPDGLELIASWLGVRLNKAQPIEQQRRQVGRATELYRRRGTLRGLELMLEVTFEPLKFRVKDPGKAVWSKSEKAVKAARPIFDVYCDEVVTESMKSRIENRIEEFKPVQMSFRLHIETKPGEEEQVDEQGPGAEA